MRRAKHIRDNRIPSGMHIVDTPADSQADGLFSEDIDLIELSWLFSYMTELALKQNA